LQLATISRSFQLWRFFVEGLTAELEARRVVGLVHTVEQSNDSGDQCVVTLFVLGSVDNCRSARTRSKPPPPCAPKSNSRVWSSMSLSDNRPLNTSPASGPLKCSNRAAVELTHVASDAVLIKNCLCDLLGLKCIRTGADRREPCGTSPAGSSCLCAGPHHHLCGRRRAKTTAPAPLPDRPA
jgi:hypothetical protein